MDTTLGQGCAVAGKARLRVNTSAEERAEYVRLFATGGKSAAEFCAELGLAESTFAVWRRQARSDLGETTFTEVPPALVETAFAGTAVPLALRLAGGIELTLARDTDATWLASLLKALR